jgi:phosphoribosyl-ATP pyrophosphohydrolase
MVLLAEKGVSLGEVAGELERREGTSGLAEKAARGAP